MIKNHRSLVARRIASATLAVSGVVAGGAAHAQIASIQPLPLIPASIGDQFTLVATGGTTSGNSGSGASATNWDNSGNYYYAQNTGLGTSTGTYGGYWGAGKSTSTNFANSNNFGGYVTINTYFQSASGGSLCSQYCGGTYDNFPIFYYQNVGAQIGSGGGTATWNLNTYSGPSPGSGFTGSNNYSDIYFAASGGSGAGTLQWTLHFSSGATATGSFGYADWASGSGGQVSGPYSYGNGGNWQGSGNDNRYIYQYRIVNPDPQLTLTSISWTRSGGTNLNVLGISATGFVPAPPGIVLTASGACITGFSMLRMRRRRKTKPAAAVTDGELSEV